MSDDLQLYRILEQPMRVARTFARQGKRIGYPKLTTKNQITLPRDVVKAFKGIDYFDASVEDGRIVLEPVRIRPVSSELQGIREKMRRLGVSEADVAEAIRWSRGWSRDKSA